MQEFQESARRVVQLTFGLNVGRIGRVFLVPFLLLMSAMLTNLYS